MTTAGGASGETAGGDRTQAGGDIGRPGDGSAAGGLAGPAGFDVPEVAARLLRRRLKSGSRAVRRPHRRPSDIYAWVLAAVVLGAMAVGSVRPALRLVTGSGWAVHAAPGRLFATAAVLLLLGGMAGLLRQAGPVTASSAFRFWLLSAPVSRRDLFRRRFVALLAATALAGCMIAALVAHTASVAVLPAVALTVLASVSITAASVWSQGCEAVGHAMHLAGRSLSAVAVAGFGSLATGLGRAGADAALRTPPAVVAGLVAALALAAVVCSWRAYRSLEQIGVGVLRRGQGLWTAGQAAALSLDAFMIADFLAEQRARTVGQVRSARIGSGFTIALARSEWVRLRRRPYLAIRAAVAAVVWLGCRPVVPGPGLAALALITGFFLVLPLLGTLRQLASGPALRAQFAPRDRWLGRASVGVCLAGVAGWAAITIPGLPRPDRMVLAILITVGITAAACRTVTRPPLDYSRPPVPTPFGDLPLDLWRQLLRGPLLLALLILVVLRIR